MWLEEAKRGLVTRSCPIPACCETANKMETLWFVCADSAIKAEDGQPGKIFKLNW